MQILSTERLILRSWRESDSQPFFEQINSDSDVMEYFPSTLSREESDVLAIELQRRIDVNGWGLWAVEEKASGQFIGFVGLNSPLIELPCSPCVEVGWRLSTAFWGKGYATEAAQKVLEFAFVELGLDEVVSFTAVPNLRSQAVMTRLGLRDTGNNFNHPAVPSESPLYEHVLFRITRDEWAKSL
ncbi:GNAT family N-acetyltransferase [Neptuniibacter sp. SY11_33]|uniref:GNAT family N-acetyltransferase n=1 Tax=Neptuniibacter sp. SY11_33 TaxID=3398215 RepID=UPI0039F54DE1